jgi:hypothetical protein
MIKPKLKRVKTMNKFKNVLVCVLMLVASGCASIMCSDSKTVSIDSYPADANFTILSLDGRVIHKGTTPAMVTLKRGRGYFQAGDYRIAFNKAGYEGVYTMPIKSKVEVGWYLGGNVVFGGLIGWIIVDPLTGAMYTMEDVYVTLPPDPPYHPRL